MPVREATKPSQVDVVGAGTIAWRQVAVLAKPKAGAAQVAVLKQFRPDFRPQYVLALDAVRAKGGKAARGTGSASPAGRTGAPAGSAPALSSSTRSKKRVIIYRGARKFEFWDGARLVRTGKVAVGAAGAETPLGLFYVTDKFNPAIDPDWAILARTHSRRARTRSSPTGQGAASWVSTGRRGRISSGRRSRTAASASTTTTSRSSVTASRSGRRSRSSAETGIGSSRVEPVER